LQVPPSIGHSNSFCVFNFLALLFLVRAHCMKGRKDRGRGYGEKGMNKTMPFPSTFRNILCSCHLKHFWTHHSAGTRARLLDGGRAQ
jgi:hypothetical protein